MDFDVDWVHEMGGGEWEGKNGRQMGEKLEGRELGVDLIKNYMSDDKCFILFLIKVQSAIFLNKIFYNR